MKNPFKSLVFCLFGTTCAYISRSGPDSWQSFIWALSATGWYFNGWVEFVQWRAAEDA